MRGLVRRMNAGAKVVDRQLVAPAGMFPERRFRICSWCWQPTDEPRRRYWHSECVIWNYAAKCTLTPYAAMKGRMMPEWEGPEHNAYWKEWADRCCAACGVRADGNYGRNWRAGADLEDEHELAISVAVELGRQAIMRAFCPGNLRYLCHDCHAAKTKQDRVILKYLRNGMGDPPAPRVPQLAFGFTGEKAKKVTP